MGLDFLSTLFSNYSNQIDIRDYPKSTLIDIDDEPRVVDVTEQEDAREAAEKQSQLGKAEKKPLFEKKVTYIKHEKIEQDNVEEDNIQQDEVELSPVGIFFQKTGIYLQNLSYRICNLLEDLLPFLWPLPKNPKSAIPTAREMGKNAFKRYQGKNCEKEQIVSVIRIPKCLKETKITLIPEKFHPYVKVLNKVIPLFYIHQVASMFYQSPKEAIKNQQKVCQFFENISHDFFGKVVTSDEKAKANKQHAKMCFRFGEISQIVIFQAIPNQAMAENIHTIAQASILLVSSFPETSGKIQETFGKIRNYLRLKNPTVLVNQKDHEKACERMSEAAKIAIYFTLGNRPLADKLEGASRATMLFAANFPELQNYSPVLPYVATIVKMFDEKVALARQAVKDTILRPIIKKLVMPTVVELAISLFEERGEHITTFMKNVVKNPNSDPGLVEAFKTVLEVGGMLNDGVKVTKEALNTPDSYLASIFSAFVSKEVKDPAEKALVKVMENTENLIAEIPMTLLVYKVKNMCWSYIMKEVPKTATGTIGALTSSGALSTAGTIIKIANPVLNGVIMIAGGGFEQSIGELAVRTSGVAIMVLTGSPFVGGAFVYGCLTIGYGIDLRQNHLERNEMEDPILEWIYDKTWVSTKTWVYNKVYGKMEAVPNVVNEEPVVEVKVEEIIVEVKEKAGFVPASKIKKGWADAAAIAKKVMANKQEMQIVKCNQKKVKKEKKFLLITSQNRD